MDSSYTSSISKAVMVGEINAIHHGLLRSTYVIVLLFLVLSNRYISNLYRERKLDLPSNEQVNTVFKCTHYYYSAKRRTKYFLSANQKILQEIWCIMFATLSSYKDLII